MQVRVDPAGIGWAAVVLLEWACSLSPLPLPPLDQQGWSSTGGNRSICDGEGGNCIRMSSLSMPKLLVSGWRFQTGMTMSQPHHPLAPCRW